MKHWVAELDRLLAEGNDVIRIVVAATQGSAPREAGASMLVHGQGAFGTLGGGKLEFQAVELAHQMLDHSTSMAHRQRFTLGAVLGQCCGGIVDLWWERFTVEDRTFVFDANARLQQGDCLVLASLVEEQACQRMLVVSGEEPVLPKMTKLVEEVVSMLSSVRTSSRVRLLHLEKSNVLLERLDRKNTTLWIFGAGHVGQAIVGYLRDLPFDITWVDPRVDIFPADYPVNVNLLNSEEPAAEVRFASDEAWFLVLTHDHSLDYAICAAVLARESSGYIGLIGSHSKAARFTHRLKREGLDPERIICPIGISGISGKEPATIAISVVAQLMQFRESQAVNNRCCNLEFSEGTA